MSILDLETFNSDNLLPNEIIEVFFSEGHHFSIIIHCMDEDDNELPLIKTLDEFLIIFDKNIDDNFSLRKCDLLDFLKDYYIIDFHNDLYTLININRWNSASLLEKWDLWLLHGYPFTYTVNENVTYNVDYMLNNITSDEEINRIIYDKDNIHKSLRRCNDATGTISFIII